ncbi:MAG: B12-binding domain-containing protein [Promethearchaeota archaeon]
MTKNLVTDIREAMIACQTDKVLELVQKAIEAKLDARSVVTNGLTPGIRVLGDRFEHGQAYLPELAVAAETMKEALKLLEPLLANTTAGDSIGTVVIGTVQGDIHDIGKTIVATMLTVAGFTVYDMGVDVAPSQFLAKAKEVKANIIAMSALLTTTMDRMRETVELLKREKLQKQIKVLVGGAPLNKRFADSIGADGYGVDFGQAIKEAKRLTILTNS